MRCVNSEHQLQFMTEALDIQTLVFLLRALFGGCLW